MSCEGGACPPAGIPCGLRFRAEAQQAAKKRCKRVRVKLRRDGRVVKRHGKPVYRTVRRCKPAKKKRCRIARVKKRNKAGKVIRRHGKPVYVKRRTCRPKPKPPPATPPTPVHGPTPQPTPPPGSPPPGELANRVLALAPRVPSDINLFSSTYANGAQGVYPSGSPMTPAAGPAPTEQQVRDRLTAYLVASLGAGSPDIARALATFDDDDLKALVDDENPTLRAAVAALTATPFESAIDTLLASGFTALRFGPLPNAANLATTSGATGSRTIVFNNRHEAEDFRILIGTMAHEVLHAEIANSDAEEAINHAIGAMLTMQTLSVSPELAYANTEYARANNTEVMIFSNSREAGSPDSEIYAPTGLGIAPDSPFDVPDLWTAFGGDGSSPGSPTLRTMLQNILVPGTPDPGLARFRPGHGRAVREPQRRLAQ